jgi:hypothetical protein
MTDLPRIVAQVAAHLGRRAVPVRATSSLARDPTMVFGIAPIRVVAEQRVQAIAFGLMGQALEVITIWNPLSRETGALEPFALALDTYLRTAPEVRIWLPHPAALEIIDLLSHRYANNENASESLRRMGAQCRVIADEATYAGQQIVAVASDLLQEHVATGQSPVEDHHLGALLAWLTPPPGVDPTVEAARRALVPAAAMLDRADDDRVDHLRRTAKGTDRRADDARREIEQILESGARAEWDLLTEARAAFWGLQLPAMVDAAELIEPSRDRFGYAIGVLHARPAAPDKLGRLLDAQELALDISADVAACSDASLRERLRSKGKAVTVVLVERVQPKRGFRPCLLRFYTRQDVLRVRPGAKLKLLHHPIVGRVVTLRAVAGRQGTMIEFEVLDGVRAASTLGRLRRFELLDTIVVDMSVPKGKAYTRLAREQPPLVYGAALPAPAPRTLPATPLDLVAATLRRRA